MATLTNNLSKFSLAIENACKEGLKEVGITAKAELQANVKVKTGNLRRSHTYRVDKDSVTVGVTRMASYGVFVEFKSPSRGGRPWFRATLQGGANTYKAIFQKHLGGIK